MLCHCLIIKTPIYHIDDFCANLMKVLFSFYNSMIILYIVMSVIITIIP